MTFAHLRIIMEPKRKSRIKSKSVCYTFSNELDSDRISELESRLKEEHRNGILLRAVCSPRYLWAEYRDTLAMCSFKAAKKRYDLEIVAFQELSDWQVCHSYRDNGGFTIGYTTETLEEKLSFESGKCNWKQVGVAPKLSAIRSNVRSSARKGKKMKMDCDVLYCAQDKMFDERCIKEFRAFRCLSLEHRDHRCDADSFAKSIAGKNDNRYEILAENTPTRFFLEVKWKGGQLPTKYDKDELCLIKLLVDTLKDWWKQDLGPLQVLKYDRCWYRLVFPQTVFPSVQDMRDSVKDFLIFIAEQSCHHEEMNDLSYVEITDGQCFTADRCCKFVVDPSVYTKNRMMRMIGQSELGNETVLSFVENFPGCDTKPVMLQSGEKSTVVKDSVLWDGRRPRTRKHVDYMRLNQHLTFYGSYDTMEQDGELPKPRRPAEMPSRDERIVISTDRDILDNIDAAYVRYVCPEVYFKLCISIICGANVTREVVLKWMNHPDTAEMEYEMLSSRGVEQAGRLSYAMAYLERHFCIVDDRDKEVGSYGTALGFLWKKSWTPMPAKELIDRICQSRHDFPTIIGVRGVMGSGKSHAMLEAVRRMELRKVLYVVGRRGLVSEMARRAKSHGINVVEYTDGLEFVKHMFQDLKPTLYLTVINSVCRIPTTVKFEMMVIDEAETTVCNLYSVELMSKIGGLKVSDTFLKSMQNTNTVVSIDAEHTDVLFDVFTSGNNEVNNITCRLITPRPSSIYLTATLCRNYPWKTSIVAAILERVVLRRERVCISMVYKARIRKLYETLLIESARISDKVPKIVCITGDEPLGDGNLNKVAQDADVLIFNSTISAGHSVDIPGHFRCMFYFFDFMIGGCPLTEQIQMTGRIRQTEERHLFYAISHARTKDTVESLDNKARICYHPKLMEHLGAMTRTEMYLDSASITELNGYVNELLKRAYPEMDMNIHQGLSEEALGILQPDSLKDRHAKYRENLMAAVHSDAISDFLKAQFEVNKKTAKYVGMEKKFSHQRLRLVPTWRGDEQILVGDGN